VKKRHYDKAQRRKGKASAAAHIRRLKNQKTEKWGQKNERGLTTKDTKDTKRKRPKKRLSHGLNTEETRI
jgi:hypothetical protein